LKRRRLTMGVAALVLFAAVGLGLVLGPLSSSAPTPTASRSAWNAWAARLRPSLASVDRDYARTGQDLSRDDQSAGRSDLERLGADARRLRALADSGDPRVDHDLSALASSIRSISTLGLAHWPQLDVTTFEAAISRYTQASTVFVHAFAAEAGRMARSN
jgi:hypothetical protein